jgi:COP9 signalosome complex subunit 6
MDVNENPLYLLLDAASCLRPSTKDLPISIYESELHVIQEKPTLMFVKIPYKIETGEAERIAVDHVARVTPSGGGDGSACMSYL